MKLPLWDRRELIGGKPQDRPLHDIASTEYQEV